MLLQFCDKCGRPLSEGCLARGEAVTRGSDVICAQCIESERNAAKDSPLAPYAGAVWACSGCGIPVTALDLIEGRASRASGVLTCARCQGAQMPEPARARAPAPRPAPVAARKPANTHPASHDYVHAARREQRRPIMPIVVFAIVLPMFAVSLYFAVTSQQRLNEAMSNRESNAPAAPAPERPREPLTLPELPRPAPTEPAPATQSPPVEPPAMPAEAVAELAALELELAKPVIALLESKQLEDVWEGLISAGSRRLVAAAPHVRALLREPDDDTRALACRVSALLSDRDALPLLAQMADADPAEPVRTEARKARDRLSGKATREIYDLSTAELEEHLRALQRELERRKAGND